MTDESWTDESIGDEAWVAMQREYAEREGGPAVNPFMQALAARFLRILDGRPQPTAHDIRAALTDEIRQLTDNQSHVDEIMRLADRYAVAIIREKRNSRGAE